MLDVAITQHYFSFYFVRSGIFYKHIFCQTTSLGIFNILLSRKYFRHRDAVSYTFVYQPNIHTSSQISFGKPVFLFSLLFIFIPHLPCSIYRISSANINWSLVNNNLWMCFSLSFMLIYISSFTIVTPLSYSF